MRANARGRKQYLHMPPAHNTTKRAGKPPNHPSSPTPGHTTTLTSYKESGRDEQRKLLLVLTPHCKAGTGAEGRAMMGRPSSPSRRRGKSLMEGASQIPGANDSTLHQLKPPHPSHEEGPVSPRRLGLATYPNPGPSSLTIPRNKRIKTTNTVWGALPLPASFGSGNPARERFSIKKPVIDTLLVSWSFN